MNQRQPRPERRVNDRRGQENGRPPAPRRQGRDRLGAYEKRFRKIYLSLVAILLAFILVFSFMIRGKIRDILGKGEPTEPAEFDVFPYHSLTGNGGGSSQETSDNGLTTDYSLPEGWETVNPAPLPPASTTPPGQPGGSDPASSTSPSEGTDPTSGTDIQDPTETSESAGASETETMETEPTEESTASPATENTQPAAEDPGAEPGDDD